MLGGPLGHRGFVTTHAAKNSAFEQVLLSRTPFAIRLDCLVAHRLQGQRPPACLEVVQPRAMAFDTGLWRTLRSLLDMADASSQEVRGVAAVPFAPGQLHSLRVGVIHNTVAHNTVAHNTVAHDTVAHNIVAHNTVAHNDRQPRQPQRRPTNTTRRPQPHPQRQRQPPTQPRRR